ncbi:MAG: hypothetical protein HN742_24340 [Lentisphaerae bacterium]|jgi:hypothetical protein|nr:hypothetical protein [Lentisphaerota bacterium]MBT4814403.1 hypothetical protein [Lentisphaerota bacterium]MBT5608952.1 hypothetical protein [Lentisphaerota bacterium]MBT7061491.1 hypothetical protein [Lentisphaerota bacterium]MBT7845029.1 hypothetical protein [Lentisphaerota bacterium]
MSRNKHGKNRGNNPRSGKTKHHQAGAHQEARPGRSQTATADPATPPEVSHANAGPAALTNLDWLAAKYGQQIGTASSDMDKIVTTALNILHEQGIYAMFLWLRSKTEYEAAGRFLQALFLDRETPISLTGPIWAGNEAMDNVRDCLTQNLKTMFLAKDLIARTLVYARHTAKAN